MRIFTTSDLHVDYPESADWVDGLSVADFTDDVLILAGDVSDLPARLERTFSALVRRFARVLFVPGNHELWVRRCGHKSSYAKFEFIKRLAGDTGVSMRPLHTDGLSIVPLLGWYDGSFGQPGEDLRRLWMDYRQCEWLGASDAEVTRFFTDMNRPWLDTNADLVISFSHFLPRIDTMPAYIPAQHRILYPVLGSAEIDAQVRALGSHIHVYGHSHVNRRVEMDGRLYLNNAFGGPGERHIAAKTLYCVHET